MTHQSEQQLEKILIEQLGRLEFSPATLEDTSVMITNLKTPLEQAELFKKGLLQQMFI